MKVNSRFNASISSDTYLYGFSLKPLANQPYIDVLVIKLSLAKKLVESLIRSDSDDRTRINSIYKAQEFNRELIKELGYSDIDIRNMIKNCTIETLLDTYTEPEIKQNRITSYISKVIKKFKGE